MVRICLPVHKTEETWVQSLGQENPLEKEMATTPVYGALWATADGVKSQTQFSD